MKQAEIAESLLLLFEIGKSKQQNIHLKRSTCVLWLNLHRMKKQKQCHIDINSVGIIIS